MFVGSIQVGHPQRPGARASSNDTRPILQHHAIPGKLRRERADTLFSQRAAAVNTPVPVTMRLEKAVTVTHQGPLEENPVSIQAPGDARSLSYGRAVCTYSFDTLRSTTLTWETVTATLSLLHHSEISHRRRIIFLLAPQYRCFVRGLNRRPPPRAPTARYPPERGRRERNGAPRLYPRRGR